MGTKFATTAIAVALVATVGAQRAVPLDTLLDRLDAYLLKYEAELSTLIAEETMRQQTGRWSQTLVSDIAFQRLPGAAGSWLGYREVRRIDQKDVVNDGPGLAALLAQPSRNNDKLAIDLAWRSARYNYGSSRTINVPTLPLELIAGHRAHFRFESKGQERIGRVLTHRIAFTEITTPSLIRPLGVGDELQSQGVIWIEPATGRVRRAEVSVNVGTRQRRFDWRLSVDFAEHRELGLLVPKLLRERFYVLYGSGEGRATYTNFRRFTTSARIVPDS